MLIDKREGYRGKAGALFVIRLKKETYYDELWRDQDQWISSPPDTPIIVKSTEHEEDADTIIGELLKN